MNDPLYREIILDHWQNPQNYGVMVKPDVDVVAKNMMCGDEIRVMAKLKKKNVDKVSFTCEGCVVAKAAASILSVMVTGMPVVDFQKMKPEEFLKIFDVGLTPARTKCALLCFSTLQKALR
jgi:nitrogen fixation protein NifU and related proteins